MLIRYTVRPDQVNPTVELLEKFFAELDTVRPGGLRYTAYQLDDHVSFVHLVESDTGAAPFASLPAYRAYRDTIEQRCISHPTMTEIRPIGGYSAL
jgi:hypothetical protein